MRLPDSSKRDAEARESRARALLDTWRASQGQKAARGRPELLRALENVAKPISHLAAWEDEPRPLYLTADQMKTACQSALSLERLKRHGQPPKEPHQWWDQIKAIADEWRVQIDPAWWDKKTAEALSGEIPADLPAVPTRDPATDPLAPPLPPASIGMKAALTKDSITFWRDMGIEGMAAQKERELADLEAQLEAERSTP